MAPKLATVKDSSVNCFQTLGQAAVIMFLLHSTQDGLCLVACMSHISFLVFLVFQFIYLFSYFIFSCNVIPLSGHVAASSHYHCPLSKKLILQLLWKEKQERERNTQQERRRQRGSKRGGWGGGWRSNTWMRKKYTNIQIHRTEDHIKKKRHVQKSKNIAHCWHSWNCLVSLLLFKL